jgi:hypothetical protein
MAPSFLCPNFVPCPAICCHLMPSARYFVITVPLKSMPIRCSGESGACHFGGSSTYSISIRIGGSSTIGANARSSLPTRCRIEGSPKTLASAKIREFHTSTLGILLVGSPVGLTREVGNGAYEQRYEFGSILKPLNGPPVYATRFLATIDITAIKCFGTDDPGGTGEPYIVAAEVAAWRTVRAA